MYLLLLWNRSWGASRTVIQSLQPQRDFLQLCNPGLAARQLACTCLLPAAVTTPSAPNSTITLPSVTEFKAASHCCSSKAVWFDWFWWICQPQLDRLRQKHAGLQGSSYILYLMKISMEKKKKKEVNKHSLFGTTAERRLELLLYLFHTTYLKCVA